MRINAATSARRTRAAASGRRALVHSFYEFFAGGGMARAGLGENWSCLFANDFDPKKAAVYEANWGGEHLAVGDVAKVAAHDLPGRAHLAWASFPCQDLSLAGGGAGLRGERSGTFWPFWRLIRKLGGEGRAPPLVVLENVNGALTSHGGKDFAAIGEALATAGYRFGALIVDAIHFVPQSRPRLFIVAVQASHDVPLDVLASEPDPVWHPPALRMAREALSPAAKAQWIWWNLPTPPRRNIAFVDLIESEPAGVRWHTAAETKKLIGMMSPVNLKKLREAQALSQFQVGAVYKRTRPDKNGVKRQRAEIRFDDVAGCLRTPAGGSSRQTIMIVEGKSVRSRLLSPREAARLMGLSDSYRLPTNYNDAYHLAGDGVVVPAVRFLATNLLEPILAAGRAVRRRAA
jgi:DNA (cytosine-5)-methyltransferase 1